MVSLRLSMLPWWAGLRRKDETQVRETKMQLGALGRTLSPAHERCERRRRGRDSRREEERTYGVRPKASFFYHTQCLVIALGLHHFYLFH